MNTIRITPDQVITIAAQFDQSSKLIQQMNDNLINQILSLECVWDGIAKQQFYHDFHTARKDMEQFVSLTSSISFELNHIAHKFMLADSEILNPPPNVDSRNGWEKAIDGLKEYGYGVSDRFDKSMDEIKELGNEISSAAQESVDSLKEMGADFVEASNERYANRYSSVGGFLDYWTAGLPKAFYQGLVDRGDKALDSPNDFANYLTLGVHGTIREAIFPTNAWSKEHLASIFGAAGLAAGVTGIKPKDILSPSVKNEVKGKHGSKLNEDGDRGETPKADGASPVNSSVISSEMERKILEGQRKLPTKNELIGGHSPKINNANPNYAVQEITVNADGTRKVKFTTQFPDGNLSNIKTSTLFPESWSDSQIINSIKDTGNTASIGIRASDGATLHRETINGVQVEVIKIGDNVVSGYPTGGGATQLLSGFTAP
ncbi:hypothetical protein AMS62_06065 [Bacillus sp. FJAT-18019]|nr:hypothetical protein AMS62_06065 [Bacillus sp. FJAT-18019]